MQTGRRHRVQNERGMQWKAPAKACLLSHLRGLSGRSALIANFLRRRNFKHLQRYSRDLYGRSRHATVPALGALAAWERGPKKGSKENFPGPENRDWREATDTSTARPEEQVWKVQYIGR